MAVQLRETSRRREIQREEQTASRYLQNVCTALKNQTRQTWRLTKVLSGPVVRDERAARLQAGREEHAAFRAVQHAFERDRGAIRRREERAAAKRARMASMI
jgi:hypothetical protein